MNQDKRNSHPIPRPSAAPTLVRASDLMKQVERMAGIRRRIREGYYSRPEVLADIARELSRRVHS